MQLSCEHVQNDSVAPRPRRPAPATEGAGCAVWAATVRLPDSRSTQDCRATYARGNAGTSATARSLSRQDNTDRYRPRGARPALIVIDASALLEILLRTNRADRLMERAFAASERLHAPHLLDIEVTQALRRLVQRRQITAVRAQQVFDDLADLLIERHDHRSLLSR